MLPKRVCSCTSGQGRGVVPGWVSVVVSTAHHLLAGGPEQDGVFKLSCVAALAVAEWGVGVHDAQVAQVLQSHQVLALPQAVQPTAAEGQRSKVLIDDVQQVLGPGQSGQVLQRNVKNERREDKTRRTTLQESLT